jgi:Flp pilus assembly protein TadG
MRMHFQRRRNERGANIVEAAIVIPLLVLLLIGVVDFGRAYFAYITIINAAREGANWGVLHPATEACGKALAEAQDLTSQGLTPNCTYTCSGGCAANTPIMVTMEVDFPLILGSIVGRPNIPITYSVTFPIRGV